MLAVESFLLGCKDKRAAAVVVHREPKTITEAQQMMRVTVDNHQALFENRTSTARQVSFADEVGEPDLMVRSANTPASAGTSVELRQMRGEFQELKTLMKQMSEAVVSHLSRRSGGSRGNSPRRSGTPPGSPRRSGSPRACFHCNEQGHFQAECPKLKAQPEPSADTALVF